MIIVYADFVFQCVNDLYLTESGTCGNKVTNMDIINQINQAVIWHNSTKLSKSRSFGIEISSTTNLIKHVGDKNAKNKNATDILIGHPFCHLNKWNKILLLLDVHMQFTIHLHYIKESSLELIKSSHEFTTFTKFRLR